MKLRNLLPLLILVLSAGYSIGQTKTDSRAKILAQMKFSMVKELLKPWYPKAVDSTYGGFLSAFTYDFKPTGNQDKMIVTQARHVWSNSKAAEVFPQDTYYKTSAGQGAVFLKNVMWDKQYGGFYTFTDRRGNPKAGSFAPKEAYGNAFAIFALAAYYQASGDTSALNSAKQCFWWLEKHSHDPVYKGYYQHMQRDGTPIIRNPGVTSTAETGYKDQNSSIHLLEAFTELYGVWPDALLKTRLNEMLLLVRDTIANKKGNLTLFFQPDWTPVSYRDSSESVYKKHHSLDHISYGHNVETTYLMLEASHALGLHNDTVTARIGKLMLDDALERGWDEAVGGFYDEGYYFKDKPGLTITEDGKNWWAQAEGLNTLLLMSEAYPNDGHQYYRKFEQLWNYVLTYLIDHEHGDWYQGGLDKQPQYKMALKGQIWKGTYHTFRALLNCTMQLDPDKTAPSVPRNLRVSTKGNETKLTWSPAKDNRRMLGYNIYIDNERIGFTPLLSFSTGAATVKKRGRISITAVDLAGNESKKSRPLLN